MLSSRFAVSSLQQRGGGTMSGFRRTAALSSLALAAIMAVAACGTGGGSGGGGSAASSTDLTAVRAEVAKYSSAPTTTGVQGDLSKKPEAGKKIIFMNNPT